MMLQAILKTAEENKATQIIGERCWSAKRMKKVREIEKNKGKNHEQAGFFHCKLESISKPEDFLIDVIRLVIYNDTWQLYAIREPEQDEFIVSESTGNGDENKYQTLKNADRYSYAGRLGVMKMIEESVTIVETKDGTWRVKDVSK